MYKLTIEEWYMMRAFDINIFRKIFSNLSGSFALFNRGDFLGSYRDVDDAPDIEVPEFKPKLPPGLHLEEDRTKQDARKYLTPGEFLKYAPN